MKEAEGLFAHRKDLQFQQACTKEQAELLELQRYDAMRVLPLLAESNGAGST